MAKTLSEAAREREALKYATVFCHIKESSERSKPGTSLSSFDAGLNAFAQIGALRLGAARCLISIFDQDYQYVIAEATPSSSLATNTSQPEHFWLGCAAVTRSYTGCDHLLTAANNPSTDESKLLSTPLPVSVVPDMTQDTRYLAKDHVLSAPHNRFYAGSALRTARGICIGAYAIFDDKPRDGLSTPDIEFMQVMSRAVMSHLELRRSAESAGRSDRMVRGIGSFVEGKSTLSNLWRGTNAAAFEQSGTEGKLNKNQQFLQQADTDRDLAMQESAFESSRNLYHGADVAPHRSPRSSLAAAAHERSENESSPAPLSSLTVSDPNGVVSSGQDSRSVTDKASKSTRFTLHSNASVTSGAAKSFGDELHTKELREVFGKAANIIRESIEVEGVAFLDATIGTFGGLVASNSDSETTSSESQPDTSGSEGREEKEDPEQKYCRIVGFSTTDASSIDGKLHGSSSINVPQRFLRALLRRYPAGKTFTFDGVGELVSGDSEEDRLRASGPTSGHVQVPLQERKRKVTQSRHSESAMLTSILNGARSVAMVPLWDSTRERWHASAFVWTRSPDRIFSVEKEVSYLRAFGSTIMAEINRIEAAHSEKMKSDLLGSLSHELRSPLHGVLAGIELIQDTELDAFQGDTLHSMESCGRTLLDVIEHLLDYSKMNRFVNSTKPTKSTQSPKRASKNTDKTLKKQQQSFESQMAPLATDVDVSLLVEETIESVYSGFSYGRSRGAQADQALAPGSLYDQSSFAYQNNQDSHRISNGSVAVYLDIDANVTWTRHVQAGGLRRIMMNILGNSMKYTNSGYILVQLTLIKVPLRRNYKQTNLKLTVTDSGKGIDPDFLRDKIFTPFSQEDNLQPGTGLGLSLIHQIITLLNGTITVESQLGRGTKMEVILPLAQAQMASETSGSSGTDVDSLKGLRVSLRGFKTSTNTDGLPNHPAPIEAELLANLCRTWLDLEIIPEDSEEIRPDCIICNDQYFDQLTRGPSGVLPPIVVVCQNGSIARAQLDKSRNRRRSDFFEFISQPIGPHKLSKALLLVMERWKVFSASPEGTADVLAMLHSRPLTIDPGSSPIDQQTHRVGDSHVDPTLSLESLTKAVAEQTIDEVDHVDEIRPVTTQNTGEGSETSLGSGYEQGTEFLLVDDNKINLKILSAFMKKMKRSYESASNGLEALQTYSASPGHFRCILMDISMPVMDGLEATRRIREFELSEKLPRSLIVALTGMASGKVQQEAFGSGVDFFLPKPVRLNQLTELLDDKGLGTKT
ncbi:hypothetical protein PFICI_00795 [Pestalotiopsis fici W106-1]|uniref:histidine kinase n=1 Tax=Pestalotiopsis fici (strain W106-1 / CGMCC3.15140) TaxID=1229662 RepID=W3XN74_PESFW|nr:uncharacterized protein PFICI_00795 [Pestalotiopsis fici W106-1]ETS86967.1 hypothetical protein PFICI_00795 [Pestalotiopsis fici W106-1]